MSLAIDTNSYNLGFTTQKCISRWYYLLEHMHMQYKNNLMSLLEVNKEDAEHLTARMTGFLEDYALKHGFKGYVIGLSGSIGLFHLFPLCC